MTSEVEVEIVLAFQHRQIVRKLSVNAGTTARDTIKQALDKGLIFQIEDVDPLTAQLGVYGECVEDHYPVKPGDRLEIYRPLKQGPMELRRRRALKTIAHSL